MTTNYGIQLILLSFNLLFILPQQLKAQNDKEYIATTISPTNLNESVVPFDPESLLPKDCGFDSLRRQRRIVGGTVTKKHEFPWVALLEYFDTILESPKARNAASLITNRYLVTAAHILTLSNYKLVAVRLCVWDRLSDEDCFIESSNGTGSSGKVVIGIEEIIIHPSFTLNLVNDIALIRLTNEIQFSNFIRPICLPTDASLDKDFTAVGWGRQGYNKSLSRYLLKINLPLVAHHDCQLAYPNETISIDRQICAGGEPKKDTCNGDSGGPLMQKNENKRWVIVGVISWGMVECGTPGLPGVYTNVFYFRDWILSNLRP